MGQPYPTSKFPVPKQVRGISICSNQFNSVSHHPGWIDEFRIFNYSRTGTEIRRDMHTTLTGNEPGLWAYWNFDDIDPYLGSRTSSDFIAKDLSPNKYDLKFGGCAQCTDYFKGFMVRFRSFFLFFCFEFLSIG
jgi:hypothetical protein